MNGFQQPSIWSKLLVLATSLEANALVAFKYPICRSLESNASLAFRGSILRRVCALVGKLFGLHSGRGSIVWTKILDDGIPLSKLLLWQIPLDPTLAPKLLALGSQGKRTRLVVFDAYTGHVSSEDILDGLLIKVTYLHLPCFSANLHCICHLCPNSEMQSRICKRPIRCGPL